ncbi:hypothetical protein J6590_030341 [Homalodisca vitripennis]|nr:hypothetical protein J6590_030341 [Homalodisca vitripennis]
MLTNPAFQVNYVTPLNPLKESIRTSDALDSEVKIHVTTRGGEEKSTPPLLPRIQPVGGGCIFDGKEVNMLLYADDIAYGHELSACDK